MTTKAVSDAASVVYTELQPPDFGVLLQLFELNDRDVECVYLRGSRAVGTNVQRRDDGAMSDWDFIIVMSDVWSKAHMAPTHDATMVKGGSVVDTVKCECGNVEIALYGLADFRRLLQEGSIWAHEAIWADAKCCFKQNVNLRDEFFAHWQQASDHVNQGLRSCAKYEAGRKWSSAKRSFRKKHRYKKTIFCAFRFVMFAIELAKTGRLADISCANHIWQQMKSEDFSTWQQFCDAYIPPYDALIAELELVIPNLYLAPRTGGFRMYKDPVSKQPAWPWGQAVRPDSGLPRLGVCTGSLSKTHSDHPVLQLLCSVADADEALLLLQSTYHIQARWHSKYPTIVQLHHTPQSPRAHAITDHLQGMICEFTPTNGWSMVAAPFCRVHHVGESSATELDWKTVKIYEKVDGIGMLLYWYASQWQVGSLRRPDASEMVVCCETRLSVAICL